MIIFESPDDTSAAASILAAVSPGHIKTIKTTTLLSVEETMDAPGGRGDVPETRAAVASCLRQGAGARRPNPCCVPLAERASDGAREGSSGGAATIPACGGAYTVSSKTVYESCLYRARCGPAETVTVSSGTASTSGKPAPRTRYP